MPGEVYDLDILRPPPKKVKIGGKEIDVSYVPCGITFEVDRLASELHAFDIAEVKAGGEVTKAAFNILIELCSTFCSCKHPEMTKDWFLKNADVAQMNEFSEIIQKTLERSYEGAEAYQKN